MRLAALVAAAMASGYLWRAAVEPSSTKTVLRLAPAAIARELSDLPFSSLERLRPSAASEGAPVAHRRAGASPEPRRARPANGTQLISASLESARPAPSPRVEPPSHARSAKPGAKQPRRRPPQGAAASPSSAASPPAPPRPQPPPPPPPRRHPILPPPPVGGETRPGWGKGDKNHTHTGPPGQQRAQGGKGKKNKK